WEATSSCSSIKDRGSRRMERPFDPALKTLAELVPADWLPLASRRRWRVTVEDSDVGTIVSGASDKLFRVHDDPEYLLHLDFESGHFRAELPLRVAPQGTVKWGGVVERGSKEDSDGQRRPSHPLESSHGPQGRILR